MMRQGDSTAIRGTGGCLCGSVRYEVRGPLRPVVDCHCAQCRRTSGHFAAFTAARPQDLGLNELLRAMLDRLLEEPGGASLPV